MDATTAHVRCGSYFSLVHLNPLYYVLERQLIKLPRLRAEPRKITSAFRLHGVYHTLGT